MHPSFAKSGTNDLPVSLIDHYLVESREAITPRPSLLDLDVKLSPHPAPDVLKLSLLLMW